MSGNWLHASYDGKNTIKSPTTRMLENNVRWKFADSMASVGGYPEEEYPGFVQVGSDHFPPWHSQTFTGYRLGMTRGVIILARNNWDTRASRSTSPYTYDEKGDSHR